MSKLDQVKIELKSEAIISDYFITDDLDNTIALTLFLPKTIKNHFVVILFPGIFRNRNGSSKSAIIPSYIRSGISCLILDFLGQGDSSGNLLDITTTIMIKQIETVISFCIKKGLDQIILIGSSSPAIVSACVAAQNDAVKLLVLEAPIFDLKSYAVKTYGPGAAKRWKENGYIIHEGHAGLTKFGYDYYKDGLAYTDCSSYLSRVNCPTIWLAGERDKYITPEESEKNSRHVKNCKFIRVPGADHVFYDKNDDKIDVDTQILGFINDKLVGQND